MRSCKYWIFPPFLSFKPFSLHIFIKTWIRNFSPRHNSEMENKQTWKFLRKCNPRDSLSTCPLKKIILFFFLLPPPLSQSESKHSDPCLRCRLKKFVTVAFFFFFSYIYVASIGQNFSKPKESEVCGAYICTVSFPSAFERNSVWWPSSLIFRRENLIERVTIDQLFRYNTNKTSRILNIFIRWDKFCRFFFLSSVEKPIVTPPIRE